MRSNIIKYFGIFLLLIFSNCTKEFLNVKPDKRLSIPNTLEDLDALINNRIFFSQASIDLGSGSTDDFFIKDGQYENITSKYAKNTYVFSKDIFEDEQSNDWNRAYERILYANVILANIDTVKVGLDKTHLRDEIKGSALFHRAANHYQLVQLFCEEYVPSNAMHSPCVPIRDDFDVTKKPKQGTVAELYEFMIDDLNKALNLVPIVNTIYRPSKPAVHLLLARIYLHMEDYSLAHYHADKGLSYKSELMHISELDSNANYVYPTNLELHPEIILNHEGPAGPVTIAPARQNISEELLQLYDKSDLRKVMFFKVHTNGNIIFRGAYRPSSVQWAGYSTNELWLIRAETNVRLGNSHSALSDLNQLLYHRYKKQEFKPLEITNPDSILTRILQERRKDLLFRGTRWEDLKRLNKDSRFAKDLYRRIDGIEYKLPVNSPNWVFPFPKLEVEINGWIQHSRE